MKNHCFLLQKSVNLQYYIYYIQKPRRIKGKFIVSDHFLHIFQALVFTLVRGRKIAENHFIFLKKAHRFIRSNHMTTPLHILLFLHAVCVRVPNHPFDDKNDKIMHANALIL